MIIKIRNTSAQGFTIVELLIVIVVIAILAAISIVAYTGISNRANRSAIISNLSAAAKQIELYAAENGQYPTTFNELLRGDNPPLTKAVFNQDPDLYQRVVYCTDGGKDFAIAGRQVGDANWWAATGSGRKTEEVPSTGLTSSAGSTCRNLGVDPTYSTWIRSNAKWNTV